MRLTALFLLFLAAGCGRTCLTDATRAATGWTAAEALFRGDKSWLGGDAAYSIDLGKGRILWLFGDSFVSRQGGGSRSGAPFARNSIAIQHGYDPASATVDFHYLREGDGTPSAFFRADTAGTWLWPGHGARLGDALFVFLWRMKARPGDDLFGFANDVPEARLISNPDQDPAMWQMTPVVVPQNPWGVFLGTGAVIAENGFLYSLSCVEPGDHSVYAARWPIDAITKGQLGDPEWATGVDAWTRQSQLRAAPLRLFSGHTEFSVHFDSATRQYVQIQSTGFPGDIMMRTAPALTGPWSEPRNIYRPPELDCPSVLTYAGKAHPELSAPTLGGRVAVTYASNSSDFASLVRDRNLYFPRFVQLDVATATVTLSPSTRPLLLPAP